MAGPNDNKKKGIRLTEEHKRKISLTMMGNKNGLGHHLNAEARMKVSLARKGCAPWNKGVQAWNRNRPWPVEVKENISRGMIAYWIQRNEEVGKS